MKLLDNELEELSVKKNTEEMSLKKLPEHLSTISKAIKLNEDTLKRHDNLIRRVNGFASSSAVLSAMKVNNDVARAVTGFASSRAVLSAMKVNNDVMRAVTEFASSRAAIEAMKVNSDLMRAVTGFASSRAAIEAMKVNSDLMRVASEIVNGTPLDIDEINEKKILIPLTNEALIEKEKTNNSYMILLNYYMLLFSFFFLEKYKKLGKVVEKIHKTKKESQFKYSRKDISIYKKSNGKTVKDILTGKQVVICEEVKGKYCRITYKNFVEQEEGWVKKSWLKNVDESKI
ncbi:hypothetical protein [Cetobacterium sp.]|uniref:hypothetical protein n=1 Tax=Cetobacterium sp. TaxID=2071632 RepID=UPI003EE80D6A